jgi:hypothetical protein
MQSSLQRNNIKLALCVALFVLLSRPAGSASIGELRAKSVMFNLAAGSTVEFQLEDSGLSQKIRSAKVSIEGVTIYIPADAFEANEVTAIEGVYLECALERAGECNYVLVLSSGVPQECGGDRRYETRRIDIGGGAYRGVERIVNQWSPKPCATP